MNIVQFFPNIFTDEAINRYNYSGTSTVGQSKMPMKSYSIFSDCMLGEFLKRKINEMYFKQFKFTEAWIDHGVNSQMLQAGLCSAIKLSRNRVRQRNFRAKHPKKMRPLKLKHPAIDK